jgi:AcrR family transcriptional regulator
MPSRDSQLSEKPRTGKLAPGMRLPREIVSESQRERLMIAMVELVDRQGFPETSIAEVATRAHVSRGAFYEHFDSAQECFAAAYDTHLARCSGQLVSAYNAPGLAPEGRVKAALEALAGLAQVWPAAARVCLADVLTVAHGTIERRAEASAAARIMLETVLDQEGGHAPIAPTLTTATMGAIRRATYTHLRERDRRELPQLSEELIGWLLSYRGQPAQTQTDRSSSSGVDGQAGDEFARGQSPTASRQVAETAPAEDSIRAEQPRERIMRAILELAANKGGANVTHRDIANAAGVSYGTFYKHFQGKQAAQLAACEAVRERLAARVRATVAAAPDWPTGIRDGLAAYLDAAAADTAATRVMALDSLSLGRPGLAFLDKRAEGLKELLRPGLRMRPDPHNSISEALAGAILEIVHEHALQRRIEDLPDVHGELTYIVLAPFVGADDAARIAAEPSPVHAVSG